MRVAVTRPRHQAEALTAALNDAGFDAELVPLIEVAPAVDGSAALTAALGRLNSYQWVVFTSANAVDVFFDNVPEGELPPLAAVGAATATAIEGYGANVALVADDESANGLVNAFPSGEGVVLFPSSDIARPVLAAGLATKGWKTDTVEAYRTLARTLSPAEWKALANCDVVTLTSPSACQTLASRPGNATLRVVTIGPTTTQAAREIGLEVVAQAEQQSNAGLVAALLTCF